MIWEQAYLFPDTSGSWSWAEASILGLPALIRNLTTLKRSGIQRVFIPSDAGAALKEIEASFRGKKDLPHVIWLDGNEDRQSHPHLLTLGIGGGFLFTPQLIQWFEQALDGAGEGKARLGTEKNVPVLISSLPERLSACGNAPAYEIPAGIFCRPVREIAAPGGDQALLATVGKPTDRLHVVEVRRRTFPIIRRLARNGITPNQITWIGFLVGLIACLLISRGDYWSGIFGAMLLYVSWVVDCMDGTVARLTFSESAFGQKLDTILGHVTNLCIFSALIWSVYGEESVWKVLVFAFFILGGIMMAYRVTEERNKIRPSQRHDHGDQKLQRFLDKINHRDYAVLVFVLALFNAFKIFLWLSIVGIQVYWLLYYWLLRRQRNALQLS